MVSEIYCSCSYVSWIVFFLKNSFFLKKSFFSKINLVWYDETLFWENVFFLSRFSFADTGDSQESMGRKGNIFYSSLSTTRSRTFRHLFTTLHMRWLPCIFNRIVCNYQTATWWDLQITIWLVDDGMLICICLLDDFDSRFLLQLLDTEQR